MCTLIVQVIKKIKIQRKFKKLSLSQTIKLSFWAMVIETLKSYYARPIKYSLSRLVTIPLSSSICRVKVKKNKEEK